MWTQATDRCLQGAVYLLSNEGCSKLKFGINGKRSGLDGTIHSNLRSEVLVRSTDQVKATGLLLYTFNLASF